MGFDLLPHRARIRRAIRDREPLDRVAAEIGWPGNLRAFRVAIRTKLNMTTGARAHLGDETTLPPVIDRAERARRRAAREAGL